LDTVWENSVAIQVSPFVRVSIAEEFCLSDDEGGVSIIPQGERLTIEFKLFFLNGDLFCFLFYVDDKKGNRTVWKQFERVACAGKKFNIECSMTNIQY
jgi:hypothetical protein